MMARSSSPNAGRDAGEVAQALPGALVAEDEVLGGDALGSISRSRTPAFSDRARVAGRHADEPAPLAVDPILGARRHLADHLGRLDHSANRRWHPEPASRPFHLPYRRHLG